MMKILTLFLFAAGLQVSAKTSAQTVSLSLGNAPLTSAFRAIEQQTPYRFVYTNEQLKAASRITVHVQDLSLEKTLELCFRDQPFSYSIEDKFIIVQEREKKLLAVAPVENDIRGRVSNEKDEPIAGATIALRGSQKGTATDSRGEFALTGIPAGSVIIISSIGYETREIIIGNNRVLNIHLEAVVNALDEMVIKGYYSTSKRLNTGSVGKIGSEEISKQPVTNVLSALEGRMPGVYIQQTSGLPGGNVNIQIRGQNSLRNTSGDNGNLPLYLIDGIPYLSSSINMGLNLENLQGGSPLNSINPSDIESIEILRDADATAIYGSRGANGVVLITTKKGKPGKLKLDINIYSGSGCITRRMDLLNTQQYLQMRTEGLKNDNLWPLPPSLYSAVPDVFLWDTTRFTDWQKVLIGGTAHMTDAQTSVSGGTGNLQFLIGANYHKETTVMPGNFADQKASLHSSISYASANKKFTSEFSCSFLAENNNLPPVDLTRRAFQLAPDAPPLYDNNGNLNWQNGTWENPLAFTKRYYKAGSNNLFGNMVLHYQLLNHLEIKSNFGYSEIWLKEISALPLAAQNPALAGTLGSAEFANSTTATWIIEPQLEYQHLIGQGKLTILTGTTFQQNSQNVQQIGATGFINDEVLNNIQAARIISVTSSNQFQYKYAALFARINYNWKETYLLNLTGRRDGSSRFGPGKQFANFGAVGAGWIFSNESLFKKGFPFISFGKLRGSFGTTGSDQIKNYGYLDSYSPTSYPYQTSGLIPNRLANPDYAWELNTKWEIALELAVLKDRIFISSSYYHNRSSNQLVGYPLSLVTGFSSVQFNLPATVQNTGCEFEIKSTNIQSKRFSWVTALNISFPRSKLVAYPNIAASSYANTYTVGQSLYAKKLFHYIGVDPTTGIYTFNDIDRSGSISSPNDLVVSKKVAQDYYGGLFNNLSLGNFQLDIFFQFSKQTGYNYLRNTITVGAQSNQPVLVLSRWQKPGDQTDVEKYTLINPATVAASNNVRQSDKIIGDASFIRLKNISLSYTLSRANKFRVYIQAQNLLTITNFQGMDPENQNADALPPLKMVTAGVQVTL